MKELTDRERELTDCNAQATDNFEYLISILSNKSLEQINDEVMDKSDDLQKIKDVDASAAVCEFLIEELSELLSIKIKDILIQRDLPSTQKSATQSLDINVIGGDLIEGKDFAKALELLSDLDRMKDIMFQFFINTYGAVHPIYELLRIMSQLSMHSERYIEPLPADSFLCFAFGINTKTITNEMVVSALVGYLLISMVFLRDNNALGVIRVNTTHVDLVVDSYNSNEVVLTNNGSDNIAYYHVYYQGFSSSGETGYGTVPLQCNVIFDVELLKGIVEQRVGLSKVIIVSWIKLNNIEHYKKLNNL